MKRILAVILCFLMLMSSFIFVNAEETAVTESEEYDPLVVAYFNVSAGPGTKDFTNIDVLNFHPATVVANALSHKSGDPIITHSYSSKLNTWKEKAYASNPDIKFVFTVANGNITDFESWFSSPDRAKTLANEMLSIIESYGYDGLDIDYEFPQGGNNPKNNYVRFMKYMREGFDALSAENGKDYILSMAVPAGSWAFSLFKMTELAEYVSYFNIMSYDLHVGTATKGITHHHTNPCADPNFAGASVEEDIALYREMGIPDDKIVAGIGMYARRWTGVANVNNGLYQAGTLDETSNEAYLHYSVLKASYINKNGYVRYWDDVAKAPYLYNASRGVFLTYDDEESAKIKAELAASEGIRGVMVFDYVTTDGIGFFDNLHTWLQDAKHSHLYSPTVEKDVTCTEEGIMRYRCECGAYYDEVIPATGEHVYGDWTLDVKPTYEEPGVEIATCVACGAVTSREIPVLEYVNPFKDVKESHWFYDAVKYCVKKGYVTGMSEDTFAPNNNLTRAQFLTMLAKVDGADLSVYENKDAGFTDVKPSHWWNEVICWAVEKGYTSGVSETKFGPNNNLTRSQLARFFYVYTEKKGQDVSAQADLSVFPDEGKVQEWALTSVKWAVAEGLIAGMNGNLAPNGNATRAQAARIMMVYSKTDLTFDLDELFSAYPALVMFLGSFESAAEISAYEAFDWARNHTDRMSFVGDNENMIYTYTYSGAAMNEPLEKYLGISNDYPSLVGKHQGDSVEIGYDADTDTVTVIFYGGFGSGGPEPVYEGFTQIDDTHFVINYSEVDSDWKGILNVELVDGNYIITSKTLYK